MHNLAEVSFFGFRAQPAPAEGPGVRGQSPREENFDIFPSKNGISHIIFGAPAGPARLRSSTTIDYGASRDPAKITYSIMAFGSRPCSSCKCKQNTRGRKCGCETRVCATSQHQQQPQAHDHEARAREW